MHEDRYRLVTPPFATIQGEGVRAGTAAVFIRFANCNLDCKIATHGFDCDTDWKLGAWYSSGEISDAVEEAWLMAAGGKADRWVVLTGGEPALQADSRLCRVLHSAGYSIAIETNGTMLLPPAPGKYLNEAVLDMAPLEFALSCFDLDWITVSPKTPEAEIRQRWCHELKYVLGPQAALPRSSSIRALHRLISPAFEGQIPSMWAIAHCVGLVQRNPDWRLSTQLHKLWGVP